MSEYQYYEFAAIDKPITREQMADKSTLEQTLQRLMEQYGRRSALVRRRVAIGLWQGK